MIRQILPHIYERRVYPEGVNWFLNTFLICLDQANVYIDSGLGTKAIEEMVMFSDQSKPNILIYTHYHFDHVWGSKGLSFAKVVACEPFNDLLKEDFERSYAYFKEIQEGSVGCVFADTLINCETQMGPITLYPAPGHTQDGLMIYYRDKELLFMGDNYPDQGQKLPEINDHVAYQKTIELALSLKVKIVLGSHCEEQSSKALESVMKSLTSPLSV